MLDERDTDTNHGEHIKCMKRNTTTRMACWIIETMAPIVASKYKQNASRYSFIPCSFMLCTADGFQLCSYDNSSNVIIAISELAECHPEARKKRLVEGVCTEWMDTVCCWTECVVGACADCCEVYHTKLNYWGNILTSSSSSSSSAPQPWVGLSLLLRFHNNIFLRVGVVSLTPNPQPGGPGYTF
jgi:hypothetical protein